MGKHKVEKFFNTAGPGRKDLNYMIDPLRRINYDEITTLIGQQRYFVLHAPRQTGKTTSLLAMVEKINDDGDYYCVYLNVESAQTARSDVVRGITTILARFASAVKPLRRRFSLEDSIEIVTKQGSDSALASTLESFCELLDKPLVLFIDEIDALVGDTLVSVLRQLRDIYARRPDAAPISVVLCGVRDIRDYRIHRSDGEVITGGSCFNITVESLRLGDFSQDQVRELYLQHTEATGQVFQEDVYPRVWELTHGQPWLVNALGRQATWKMPEGRDRSRPVTLDMVDEAANQLILSRTTHLDQLTDKLREPRVRRVLEAALSGEEWTTPPSPDDIQYVIDLGLLRREEPGRALVISNAIYREVIPRELTYVMQDNLASHPTQPWYVTRDDRLDMKKLLREFQQFFRENAESWKERFDYKEAGFQLLLQAFLQRVVNGRGTIGREYALGSGRVDLLVRWQIAKDAARNDRREQRVVLELKVIRANGSAPERRIADGLAQTARYADQSNSEEAHLIVCDERTGRGWDEKIYERVERLGDREIYVWGL
jgi:hypothetical protein